MIRETLRRHLNERQGLVFGAYATIAAFSVYFCMYAFRRPFTAAEYAQMSFLGIDYKILLILSQVAGYTLSKFIGIKVIAEMPRERRIPLLIGLIVVSELALIGLGLVPYPYNFPLMFINGLPLGMVWGIVFSFVEGRQSTEALAAGLSASFIVSSGVVKAVGKFTIETMHVPEFWMPAVTGLIFLLPFLFFTWMLSKVPPPSESDELARTERVPLTRSQRKDFVKLLFWSLVSLVITHMFLTALRDYRDKFTREILESIGFEEPTWMALTEMIVALLILAPLGATMAIKVHRSALTVVHLLLLVGFVIAGGSTWAYQQGMLHPLAWFILAGTGLYLAYVPFHSMLFERVIALFRHPGNAGFLIYIADASGYLCSVAILLYKNFGAKEMSPIEFFIKSTYVGSGCGFLLVAFSLYYLLNRNRAEETDKHRLEASPVGD